MTAMTATASFSASYPSTDVLETSCNDIMDRSYGLMQPLHSVILSLELHLGGQVILAVLGGVTELLSEGGGLKEVHLITIIV